MGVGHATSAIGSEESPGIKARMEGNHHHPCSMRTDTRAQDSSSGNNQGNVERSLGDTESPHDVPTLVMVMLP